MTLLTACDSTQDKNERAKLTATRELESRKLQRAMRPNPDVKVTRVSLVRGRRSTAIVVDLRGSGPKPLTDVPITVGVRTPRGRKVPLNARKGLDWFQTHVPAIPAGGATTWVFRGPRRMAVGERPFATVGVPRPPVARTAAALPRLDASLAATGGDKRRRAAARVLVENGSDVPQYGLQVYALVLRGGRYVAAGKAEVEHLGTGQRTVASVPLTGPSRGRELRVHAVPTIFE